MHEEDVRRLRWLGCRSSEEPLQFVYSNYHRAKRMCSIMGPTRWTWHMKFGYHRSQANLTRAQAVVGQNACFVCCDSFVVYRTFRDTSLRAAMFALAFCFPYFFYRGDNFINELFSFNRDRDLPPRHYGLWLMDADGP